MFKQNSQFVEHYSNFYPLVFNTIYAKIESYEDAEDISQNLFIKLYDKLESVENVRKWLFGAIRLELFNYYRSKKKMEVDVETVLDDAAMTYVNGFRDVRIIIEEALNNMNNFETESERVLFDLIAVNKYSYNEASKEMGLSKDQVRYKYNKVCSRLLNYLHEKGIENLEELL